MSYLAQGLMNGFGQGFSAGTDRKRDEKRMAEDAKQAKAEQQLREDALLLKADEGRRDRIAARQLEIERNNRFLAGQRTLDDERTAKANDPREQLARAQAERSLSQLNTPDPAAQLREDIARMKLEKEHAHLTGKTPAPAPTAKIRQPIGKGGYAEFEAPVSEVPNLARASAAEGFRSPVARQLADVEKKMAAEQAAIDSGDHRSGFMNMGSRRDTLANLERERVRLQALDLQAKVKSGVLTQEEADAEADRLMTGAR
jgi:hypothetical protein